MCSSDLVAAAAIMFSSGLLGLLVSDRKAREAMQRRMPAAREAGSREPAAAIGD